MDIAAAEERFQREYDEQMALVRREFFARSYPKALAIMTARMEMRIQPLRRGLLARVGRGDELSDEIVAAEVRDWWSGLYPEERRFMVRYFGEVAAPLEKALLRQEHC